MPIETILKTLEGLGQRECWSGGDGSTWLWRHGAQQVLGRIGAWQQWLRQRGVRPGDRVAIELPRGPELLPAQLAVLASGACAVPINSALAPVERLRVLERAAPRAAIEPHALPGAAAVPFLAESDPRQPALLIFTSGTTGDPKGVPLTLANLEANLRDLQELWELSERDRLLHVLPAHHVHGLVLALYGGARAGMPIVLAPRFDAASCPAAVRFHAITVLMAVPTMYHRLLQAPADAELGGLRLCISGSAPLAAHDFEAFRTRFGHAPLERYGLSETLVLTSNPLRGERRAGSVGLPLPSVELRLAADGEIEARGGAVFAGYWQDETTTRASFRDGFFRTGDLGERDGTGYVRISGRKKDLIIVGGSNVLPGEVEAALAGEPQVEELGVCGLSDADRGEIVAVFAVLREGAAAAAVEERLRARAQDGLAPYKRPRQYRFVPALPRNAMGKLDRRALQRTAADN
jgi:malonyl-CoA/methylmalonyl-CoA synthetase